MRLIEVKYGDTQDRAAKYREVWTYADWVG
jgi:hypothetical protein